MPPREHAPALAAAALAAALAAAALAAGVLIGRTTAPAPPAPAPVATGLGAAATATTTPAATAQDPAGTSGQCPGGTPAPGGACLRPPTVQWLPSLPDPTTIDRTDADAVATAHTITRQTWDASADTTTAYAAIRASVYETPALAATHTPDPDNEKGQTDFLPLIPHRAHTTATIIRTTTEGRDPNPLRPDGTWQRAITWQRTYSDDSHPPVTGTTFVTLTRAPDGTWAVSAAT